MQSAEKYFKNESIFQGIKEFETPSGRIRCEKATGCVALYVERGKIFVFYGYWKIRSYFASPAKMYEKLLEKGAFNESSDD